MPLAKNRRCVEHNVTIIIAQIVLCVNHRDTKRLQLVRRRRMIEQVRHSEAVQLLHETRTMKHRGVVSGAQERALAANH